jgi:hypothetical protein
MQGRCKDTRGHARTIQGHAKTTQGHARTTRGHTRTGQSASRTGKDIQEHARTCADTRGLERPCADARGHARTGSMTRKDMREPVRASASRVQGRCGDTRGPVRGFRRHARTCHEDARGQRGRPRDTSIGLWPRCRLGWGFTACERSSSSYSRAWHVSRASEKSGRWLSRLTALSRPRPVL